MASLLISAGALLTLCALVAVAAPFLAADMRRTVERGRKAPPDSMSITLMVFGPSVWVAGTAAALWLGAVWK